MIDENEVTEVTEVTKDEQAQIQAEQERLEQERLEQERLEQERIEAERQAEIERQEAEERAREQAREQARIEHENYLNSFPDTTVFYQELKEEGDVKWLCGTIKDAHTAESFCWLDNHFDESELTLIGNIYYLKGYEKPEQSEEEKMKIYAREIERQIDEHLQQLASSRGYDDVKSCCGYYNSSDEIFQKEARAMTLYRDHLYRTGYNIIEKCQKGEIDYRTVTLEYVLSLIDPIEW